MRSFGGWIVLLFSLALGAIAVGHSAATAPGRTDRPTPNVSGKRYALIVGVNTYEDPSIGGLRYAVADAKAMQDALRGLGWDEAVLLASDQDANAKPTRPNIVDRLDQLARIIEPDDTLLLYFSGHGFSLGGKAFLATSDCRAVDADSLEETALSMDLLKRRMSKIKARSRVFILDACRNDPTSKTKGADDGRTELFTKELVLAAKAKDEGQVGTAVLFACSEGQRSYELPEWGHGAFTYFLLQGLQDGEASERDGTISPYAMVAFAQKKMSSWSLRNGKRQHPDAIIDGAVQISLGTWKPIDSNHKETGALPGGAAPAGRLKIGSRKRSAKGDVEMVYVPESEFTMGGDGPYEGKPIRKVFLEGYWIGLNDVKVAQFRAYCEGSGYKFDWVANRPSWGWLDDHPMVNVTWQEAHDYCLWAGGDLPTEAQWEKAARGEGGRIYPWGGERSTTKLWCSKSALGDAKSTEPVGSFPSGASPYGCLDMAGNVWQWCLDNYGKGVGSGDGRLLRGGSWFDIDPAIFRCAFRLLSRTSFRNVTYGFRLAGRL